MAATTTTRIFLTGMMGCGKTSVGNALAELLEIPYLDNDALLAQREGHDLVELAEVSAEHLHDAEARLALDLAQREPPFIAGVAASVIERAKETAALREAGLIVYLRARASTLAERVRASHRPFVQGDPLEWMSKTLKTRGPIFEAAAHLIIDTDSTDPPELAKAIARQMEAR